jgi:hypothetical protein
MGSIGKKLSLESIREDLNFYTAADWKDLEDREDPFWAYVEEARAYPLPTHWHQQLPAAPRGLDAVPSWSTGGQLLRDTPAFSDSGLRRKLNTRLNELQSERAGRPAPDSRPQADHVSALVDCYVQVNNK